MITNNGTQQNTLKEENGSGSGSSSLGDNNSEKLVTATAVDDSEVISTTQVPIGSQQPQGSYNIQQQSYTYPMYYQPNGDSQMDLKYQGPPQQPVFVQGVGWVVQGPPPPGWQKQQPQQQFQIVQQPPRPNNLKPSTCSHVMYGFAIVFVLLTVIFGSMSAAMNANGSDCRSDCYYSHMYYYDESTRYRNCLDHCFNMPMGMGGASLVSFFIGFVLAVVVGYRYRSEMVTSGNLCPRIGGIVLGILMIFNGIGIIVTGVEESVPTGWIVGTVLWALFAFLLLCIDIEYSRVYRM